MIINYLTSYDRSFRKLDEGSGSFSTTPHPEDPDPERSEGEGDEGSLEILQPFGLQDDQSVSSQKNSPTGQLDRIVQEKAIFAIDSLLEFFKTRQKPEGLGLKKVYKSYWEIRIDIKNRIIFELDRELVNIIFVGDHNAVKKFLKNAY